MPIRFQEYQRSRHVRGGYGLLVLLVALAIGMVVYYLSVVRVQSALRAIQEMSPDKHPWVQEDRIKDPAQEPIDPPSPEQAQVTQAMEITAQPMEGEAFRGKLTLVLYPDGTVAGYWAGYYSTPTVNRREVLTADIRGSIDSSKVYADENGEDPSKLYFVTKGNFLMLEELKNGRTKRASGEIFVNGWFEKDVSAHGELHLTTNRKDQVVFPWRSGRAQPMKEAIFGP